MRPSVDIEFSDLSYTAGRCRIIKGISGHFRSGELTAIMGPSGAGKSTLMNILAGYVTAGVKGSININGEPRRLAVFNKLSVYIMQEDLLQPYLTVRECMNLAARLKLGPEYTDEQITKVVEDLILTLGLGTCADNYTNKVSGGQRKRISVALELVNNPPVIFLDEPTTGLDVVAINQIMQLLHLLASQGRNVICTIHQPSSSLFHSFSKAYMIARGKCLYQGTPQEMVPFLSNAGLDCPQTYNPADFIFEVLQFNVIDRLCEDIQNGKISKAPVPAISEFDKPLLGDIGRKDLNFPNSFWKQFSLLFCRMMTQKKRNMGGLWLQVLHHLFSGILVGIIFRGVGNDATRPFDNFKFILCVCVFFMYTHCMIPVLTYPFEIKVMKREFFNRYYSLKAFYAAQTCSTLPHVIILGLLFTGIVYVMSDQPMESRRFFWFTLSCMLIALTSEGLGIAIGYTFKCTNGTVICPSTMAPIFMIALHGMGYGEHIHPLMRYLMNLSFVRFTLVSIVSAMYLDNRQMSCYNDQHAEIYCHFKDAKLLVRDLGMAGESPAPQLIGILFYLILFRVIAFFSLRYRCTTEFSNKILLYLTKIIKRQ